MENVQTAHSRDILDRLSQLPVLTWQAGAEGVRHIGPAEQDFHVAFGLGQPGEGISTLDLDGVALASIQALYQMVQEKDAQIRSLTDRKTPTCRPGWRPSNRRWASASSSPQGNRIDKQGRGRIIDGA